MKTFEYDLRYAQSGLEVLVDYLLSDKMFWPLTIHPPAGDPDYPRFTLGGLLLSIKRLGAFKKSLGQTTQLNRVNTELDVIRSKWRVAWERKVNHNFSIRLRMWGEFVDEYRLNPQENADRYAYEIRLRVMLDLFQAEGGGGQRSESDLLTMLDSFIRKVLISDGFIWEPEIESGFPEDHFWYLYGDLPNSATMV